MKFAVLAALFAVTNAAISIPFSMDELALLLAKSGKARFDLYVTMRGDAWKKEDDKNGKTRAAGYYTAAKAASDKWADDIVKAAGVTGQALTDLWESLQDNRLKLDVQIRETEKATDVMAADLVKNNPELKAKLATDADLKSFTDAVTSIGNQLVEEVQKKSESALLDKAEAGIFSLDAAAQKKYDETQLELNQAAEKKAKENAEAAVEALKAAKAAGTWKDDGLSVADKIKLIEEAAAAQVANLKSEAAAAKAQMGELKKLGLFATGADALTDEEAQALVKKQKDNAEAAAAAANPIPGKDGYPCGQEDDGVDEDGEKKFKRFACAENYCCGTAWTMTVDEGDTLNDAVSFHVSNDPLKQRLEVCGKAKMDDPDGDKDDAGAVVQVDNNSFTTTYIKDNIPVQLQLSFACITGAKALAASAAAVLGLYTAM